MNWLVLTILAIISRASYSIAIKVLSKDVLVSPFTHTLLLTTVAGLLSLLLSPFLGGLSFNGIEENLLTILILVISLTFGNVLFFKGLTTIGAGTAQIAFSSILIWGTILAILFLDSSFSPSQLIGILLMIFAIFMVQFKAGKIVFNIGIMYILASAVSFSLFQVASAKLSSHLTVGTYLFLAYFGTSVITVLIYNGKILNDLKSLRKQVRNTFSKTLFASGASLLYFLFSYLAFKYSPDRGVVLVLLTLQVILSVLLGIIVLKEKDQIPRKLLAALLAFVSGLLIIK